MKYLVLFTKAEPVRWLGHLDLLRTFERAIRRADLPIAFTAGFNPRERLAFANALSVGVTGAAEPLTIELTESLEPELIISRLNEKLPPGIQLTRAELIPDLGFRDLLNSYDRADLQVICVCDESISENQARESVSNLLSLEQLEVTRERDGKTKRINIRPFIDQMAVTGRIDSRMVFLMRLTVGNEGAAKPQEIVAALAESLPGLAVRRIHRIRLTSSIDPPPLEA